MEISEAIRKRRSVRKFKDKRVPREDLKELVDFARLAPSGMNKQSLEFLIVDEPDLEKELFRYANWAGAIDWSPSLENRPRAYIVILVNEDVNPATENHDAGLASANICLGAVGKGLDSCLLGAIDKEATKKLLKIPNHFGLDLAIGLGYSDQKIVLDEESDTIDYWLDEEDVFHVPKKPLEELLHINYWRD